MQRKVYDLEQGKKLMEDGKTLLSIRDKEFYRHYTVPYQQRHKIKLTRPIYMFYSEYNKRWEDSALNDQNEIEGFADISFHVANKKEIALFLKKINGD
jgi:hypothetical protein